LISVQAIEPLKIPLPKIEDEQQIEKLLHVEDYKAIDILVYKLYELDKEEIEFIEN
jgi:hypothetical protein